MKPFQTHYFSENLAVRESNPDLWIYSQELWPVNHRGSLQYHITVSNPEAVLFSYSFIK
jgi:hypothetical protein